MPRGGLLFLAVPDAAVAAMARRIAAMDPPADLSVVHVSGALGLGALDALHDRPIGSFHPLQSFPFPRDAEAFRGITVAVDASTRPLLARLRRLARALGAKPKHVPDSQRVLYHAAAVFASNYVVASVAEGVRLLESAGWKRAEAEGALAPLVEGVVANLRRRGLVAALTGPVRRGDSETVARHLAELEDSGLYRMLGLVALRIAVEAGLEPAKAKRTSRALTRDVAATRRRSGR